MFLFNLHYYAPPFPVGKPQNNAYPTSWGVGSEFSISTWSAMGTSRFIILLWNSAWSDENQKRKGPRGRKSEGKSGAFFFEEVKHRLTGLFLPPKQWENIIQFLRVLSLTLTE